MSQRPPIAIVAALDAEIGPARSAIRSRKKLHKDGLRHWVGLVDPAQTSFAVENSPRTCVAAVLGMGQKAVETSLRSLVDQWHPSSVVLVGLAGGCSPDARPGALYIPSPMLVEPPRGPNDVAIEGRDPLEPAVGPRDAIVRAAAAVERSVKAGAGVTINVIAATYRAKDSLWRNREAVLCDMETFWAARFCAREGIAFAAVRAIYDGPRDQLPTIPGLGQKSIVSIIARNPWTIFQLPRLGIRYGFVRRAGYDAVTARIPAELAAT